MNENKVHMEEERVRTIHNMDETIEMIETLQSEGRRANQTKLQELKNQRKEQESDIKDYENDIKSVQERIDER